MVLDVPILGRMTAELLVHPTAGAIADETVRRSIKALCRGRNVDMGDIARGIGMPRSTFYRRLSGTGSRQPFTAGEVALIATYFGIPIGDLFTGLGGAVAASEADVTSAQSCSPCETATVRDEIAARRRRAAPRELAPCLPKPVIGKAPHLQIVTCAG